MNSLITKTLIAASLTAVLLLPLCAAVQTSMTQLASNLGDSTALAHAPAQASSLAMSDKPAEQGS
ncbi:hypothetical protein ABWL39_18255 [Chitinivorax sp. PXF-14]|uniref:hypothetical protein n=1 Tax=Chitinivorax sp. PXF-14 TaxID=3230488 RepID=UPI003466B062